MMRICLDKILLLSVSFSLLIFGSSRLSAQNVGIGIAAPTMKLHVLANSAADGLLIDNIAGNGDPIMQYSINGAPVITMGIDDSDADKFKIGTTQITTNTRITIETGGNIGIRTTTPTNMLNMTNGGINIGATSMANFQNQGIDGVAIAARNSGTTNGYNAVEGITEYNGTAFIPSGVFGLAIYNGPALSPTIGARGHTNEWQGTGVRGSRFNGGGANNGWGGQFYDDLGYTGFFGTISDLRTKKDILPITGALAIVSQLRPVRYHFDLEKYPTLGLNTEEEFGFIAQEVNQVLPNITRIKSFSLNACEVIQPGQLQENQSTEFMTMDYSRIIPILTQAINEQQVQIEELKLQSNKVAELQKELDVLKAQMADLKN